MNIKIGTRRSKLALWQAEFVKNKLEQNGINATLVPIETKGDKVLDVSISKIGSKGVFTEELEDMLKNSEVDIAVHSAKDLPSELPPGFEILAFSARERENDVVVSRDKQYRLDNEKAAFKIGTSSTRRIATLAYHFPKVETVDIRGNLQTRIRKMESGLCDALLLAYAGVARMGYDNLINQALSLDVFTPAVGQGSLALEIVSSLDKDKKDLIRQAINDENAEVKLRSERAYLRKLKGGCSIPAFANAQIHDDEIILKAGIYSLDGSQLIQKTDRAPIADAENLGTRIGEAVLHDGGSGVLEMINKELNR
jgi:hydroxymethylbilane synthase